MLVFDGVPSGLLWGAACIFLFGLWVSSRDLPVRYALLISAIKVAIPFLYFSKDLSGSIHVSDDLAYFYESLQIVQRGYNLLSIFTDPLGIPMLLKMTGGHHVVYHLWNVNSLSLIGPYYFAPVLFNVGATFVAGYFFVRILKRLDFTRTYYRLALAFFLLHWEVLAWSSFLNLKDILVMTLTLALLNQCLRVIERPGLTRWTGMLLLLSVFVFLRMYIPFLVLTALILYLGLSKGGTKKWMLLGLLIVALACAAIAMSGGILGNRFWFQPGSFAFGAVRFVLTPLPWNVDPKYGFLFLPSILHLVAFVPAVAGFYLLWKHHPQARLALIYFILVVGFYAVIPGLQEVRQRVQIGFVFAWVQFHALWVFSRTTRPERSHRLSSKRSGRRGRDSAPRGARNRPRTRAGSHV